VHFNTSDTLLPSWRRRHFEFCGFCDFDFSIPEIFCIFHPLRHRMAYAKNFHVALTNTAFRGSAPLHMATFYELHSADSTLGGAVESMGVMKKAVLYARVSTDAQEKDRRAATQAGHANN
jgi:hypothetical protein